MTNKEALAQRLRLTKILDYNKPLRELRVFNLTIEDFELMLSYFDVKLSDLEEDPVSDQEV